MRKPITAGQAEKEINRLQHFLELVNNYETDTLEKWIIKEYALTNSMMKIKKNAYLVHKVTLEKYYIKSVILSTPKDELHKLVKLMFRYKIKKNSTNVDGL
ncbi:hypothetical protein AM500_04925 [Bacillus sp. FJAT-18017]|uniref:hypothetical protein n=1 Tax=Bacillus sp. FJAT-18017 TaxID=1705566 RepID=UPI0006AF80F0|nr:hypothetical protein [Bacillus sp. FJAT-18017]ALC89202.1 hypothetical protein AM500_04925 [Bacillus sp. FJAT-18017]